MDWFKSSKKVEKISEAEKHVRTEGLWIKCDGCGQIIWRKDLEETLQCCPKCEYHFKIDARTRVRLLMDEGYTEFDRDLVGVPMSGWQVPALDDGPALLTGGVLVELKFHAHMPALFHELLPRLPVQQPRVSKYRRCVEVNRLVGGA